MSLRPIALALAFATLGLSQTVSTRASACGGLEPEDVVNQHFAALNAHDRGRVLAHWDKNASVVSLGTPALVEPIDQAATRWVQTKQPVTFHIDKVEESDGKATARVTVVFDGKKIEDTLLLTPFGYGGWRIAGKTSAIRY